MDNKLREILHKLEAVKGHAAGTMAVEGMLDSYIKNVRLQAWQECLNSITVGVGVDSEGATLVGAYHINGKTVVMAQCQVKTWEGGILTFQAK